MLFKFLKGYEKEEDVSETLCGPQSLNSLSFPLEEQAGPPLL